MRAFMLAHPMLETRSTTALSRIGSDDPLWPKTPLVRISGRTFFFGISPQGVSGFESRGLPFFRMDLLRGSLFGDWGARRKYQDSRPPRRSLGQEVERRDQTASDRCQRLNCVRDGHHLHRSHFGSRYHLWADAVTQAFF